MTKREVELASLLLEAASDRFANHACNDYELPQTWSQSERSEMIKAIDRWDDPDNEARIGDGETLVVDWLAMRYLSTKLMSLVTPLPHNPNDTITTTYEGKDGYALVDKAQFEWLRREVARLKYFLEDYKRDAKCYETAFGEAEADVKQSVQKQMALLRAENARLRTEIVVLQAALVDADAW